MFTVDRRARKDRRANILLAIFAAFAFFPTLLEAQVLTSQYDNARTGTTLTETTVTPANVNVERFGKIFSWNGLLAPPR